MKPAAITTRDVRRAVRAVLADPSIKGDRSDWARGFRAAVEAFRSACEVAEEGRAFLPRIMEPTPASVRERPDG